MIGMMTQEGRDALELWRRTAETMMASAIVVDRRTRMMTSGRPLTPFEWAELGLMVPEKIAAFGLANLAIAEAWLAGTAGAGASWAATWAKALDPVHSRATANARRLRRRRR